MYKVGDIVFYKDFKVKAEIIHSEEIIDGYSNLTLYYIKIIKSFNTNYPLNKKMCSILDRFDWFKLDGVEQIKKKQSHLPSWW